MMATETTTCEICGSLDYVHQCDEGVHAVCLGCCIHGCCEQQGECRCAPNWMRHTAALATVGPSGARMVAEGGGWSIFIPGLPLAGDGTTVDEAIDEMIAALRGYAEDWQDRLHDAPNHASNWGLVQLVSLSDDDQLRDWLVGSE